MLLLSHKAFTVCEDTYDIKLDNGKVVQYKEWTDDNGKIIDTVIKDNKGKEIEDSSLLQKILNFVDKSSMLQMI